MKYKGVEIYFTAQNIVGKEGGNCTLWGLRHAPTGTESKKWIYSLWNIGWSASPRDPAPYKLLKDL